MSPPDSAMTAALRRTGNPPKVRSSGARGLCRAATTGVIGAPDDVPRPSDGLDVQFMRVGHEHWSQPQDAGVTRWLQAGGGGHP
jgi:hypothetical protein